MAATMHGCELKCLSWSSQLHGGDLQVYPQLTVWQGHTEANGDAKCS